MKAVKALKTQTVSRPAERAKTKPRSEPRPARLVYTQAPVQLGRVVAKEPEGWRVAIGHEERLLPAEESVDPALLAEAVVSRARVVIDMAGAAPVIVGVVSTRRALTIEPDGRVEAEVKEISVTAHERILLRVPGAFVRVTGQEVELYANKVLTRARELAKVLAAMIKMN